jgi:hypothetical protein
MPSAAGRTASSVVEGRRSLRLAADWVYQPYGELVRSDFPHTYATVERKPLGVVEVRWMTVETGTRALWRERGDRGSAASPPLSLRRSTER